MRRPHGHRTTLLTLLTLLVLAACEEAEQQAAPPPPAAVGVTEVVRSDITRSSSFVGRVEAKNRVDLRARVEGFIEQRLFVEGGTVSENQLLFVLEKAPYEAALEQAKASLAQAEASLEEAKATAARVTRASRSGAVSQQTVDEAVAQEKMRAAEVLGAKATLERAWLDLGYTDVVSPIAGRIGRARYSVGNFVGPESGTLATLVSQDPIYVVFPISQRIILEYQKARGDQRQEVQIRLRLIDGSFYDEVGRVDFGDIEISRSTDTLDIRAVFPNPEGLLIDGQFVTAVVETQEPISVLLVPRSAVQTDQAGRFVMVVNDANEVEQRRIAVGQEFGADFEVTEGLQEGDRVIVAGIQKVRQGQAVQPSEIPVEGRVRALSPDEAPAADPAAAQ